MRLTPEQFQEKQARNLKASIDYMRSGISNVTESPTLKAANRADKMLANLSKSIQDGKWASRLKAVSLEEWKEKMLNKGLPRVAGGIDAAKSKVIDFAAQLLPAIDNAKKEIVNMPDLTLEDNINRMTSFIRKMSQFKKK